MLKRAYPKNRKPIETYTTKCGYCNKEITVPMSRIRKSKTKIVYCSKKCQNLNQIGRKHNNFSHKKENNGNWRGGIMKPCEICGKMFWVSPYRKEKARFCSQICQGKTKCGKSNYNWSGGKTLEIYPREFNKSLKEKIRKQYGYKCFICGVPQIECIKKLAVHHIDYNKKNNSEENLISLCSICHNKTNHNRTYWTKYFNKKMEVYSVN